MGLFGKSSAEKELEARIVQLEAQLLPEHNDLDQLKRQIDSLTKEEAKLNSEIAQNLAQLFALEAQIDEKSAEIIQLDDEILYQSYSLYKPIYDFATSDEYKAQLEEIRNQQKAMIKANEAVSFSRRWTVDGSAAKGKKMTNDNIKQILRCFNNECENAIDRVKYNNIESMRARIQKSYETLNKLNQVNTIAILPAYFNLKTKELNLAVEYALKKQEEKEAQKKVREELREQQKLDQELKAAREKIAKERKHYNIAVATMQAKLDQAEESEKESLEAKLVELRSKLLELDNEEKNVDYREQNAKAGYVYIISNLGAFGENIYKIGMTRRLEPLERVNELGDASVPFPFDVHALIFSEDAPKLENALHKAFEDKKVNMVNNRREFFYVSLQEIETVVKESFDRTVDFLEIAPAEQYRQSRAMRTEKENNYALLS